MHDNSKFVQKGGRRYEFCPDWRNQSPTLNGKGISQRPARARQTPDRVNYNTLLIVSPPRNTSGCSLPEKEDIEKVWLGIKEHIVLCGDSLHFVSYLAVNGESHLILIHPRHLLAISAHRWSFPSHLATTQPNHGLGCDQT